MKPFILELFVDYYHHRYHLALNHQILHLKHHQYLLYHLFQ